MSITDTDVANVALDHLKENVISSFDDDKVVGRWMKRNYFIVRDIVLAVNPWRFAVDRIILSEALPVPVFGYSRKFTKPTDSIRILPLRSNGEKNGRLIDHSVEGLYILTNAPGPLKVQYIKKIADATLFSPLFIDAFSMNMALRLAPLLTGKQGLITELKASYKETLTQAMFIDSAEGSAATVTGFEYDDARYLGSSEYY
jgi:hypothetical protein